MRIKRMGWRPDLPDHRDYGLAHPKLPPGFVHGMAAPLLATGADAVEVDFRHRCPPVRQQGQTGSCTAHGVLFLHEFLELKTYGRYTALAPRFLYKVTRDFIGVAGDTGAEIRNAMGALALFGAPPEEYDPYVEAFFDREPTTFQYVLAGNYKGTQYARIDAPGTRPRPELLDALKATLLHGWPVVFGFTCFESLDLAGADGAISFPGSTERVVGGHCVALVGFSDQFDGCANAKPGAFRLRNSWGTSWGDLGYGWLPYDYVLQGLAVDFWTLTKADWVDPAPFK